MFNNDARIKRVEIFEDTMKMCKSERLANLIKNSIENTIFYAENDYPEIKNKGFETKISVTKERSFECAARLSKEYSGSKICVHNFASATNPGGGVTNGSSAQEEALCRCSTLYPCLTEKNLHEKFYRMHRNKKDLRYTDCCIYTPEITVIKSDTDFPEPLAEELRFNVDVLTCAAPNLREKPYNSMNPGSAKPLKVSDKELFQIHEKSAEHMLTIAAANGAEVFVLGAFGCGAFRNNPNIVAKAYNEVLPKFKEYFKEICFAVYCPPNNSENYDVFEKVMNTAEDNC
ncbi:MAG: TIGR02452 family protein [Muribaculaceae bacterium]|nr:TIGR02452 family protein [Muribaculaceae bacterium]MCM1480895.1 TIGR02452 family protein [Muribaculaceae bacterium]